MRKNPNANFLSTTASRVELKKLHTMANSTPVTKYSIFHTVIKWHISMFKMILLIAGCLRVSYFTIDTEKLSIQLTRDPIRFHRNKFCIVCALQ